MNFDDHIPGARHDEYNDDDAKREGWALFECDDGYLRLQVLDCPRDVDPSYPDHPLFDSDDAAIAHVRNQAAKGSSMHAAALALHKTRVWSEWPR